jgi:hypothetical protein
MPLRQRPLPCGGRRRVDRRDTGGRLRPPAGLRSRWPAVVRLACGVPSAATGMPSVAAGR